jgi:anti-sigma regulatory factor (Ser/Thr protein kinase)
MARQFAREVLGSEDSEVLDTVQLLVSELVTNAVVHARSAPTVAIHLFDDHVHVEVLDDRGDGARLTEADLDAESGRGVALVDALAQRWGSLTVERGKIVWFDVGRDHLLS